MIRFVREDGHGGGACSPSSLGNFQSSVSLRMTSQTKESPFLKKKKKKKIWRQESSQCGQVPSRSVLGWALPPGLCHPCAHKGSVPSVHTPTRIPSHRLSWSPGSGYSQPFKVERLLVFFLLLGWFWSGVERATLVLKHTLLWSEHLTKCVK